MLFKRVRSEKVHFFTPSIDIGLVLAFSLLAWAPLLTPAYFFNAHDAKHSVFFLVEFDQTFRDGFWWPRWSPDFAFGYGYPLFNMYAPLAFYAAELIHLLGLGFTASVKTSYVLATIGAGVGMYGFSRRLFGREAGLLAAVVYMYGPFHLVEIFVRSAYAEFVALALIPWLFWAFTEVIAAPNLPRLALAGLAYGLLALTHHTSFFTFSPVLMVYIVYLLIAKTRLRPKPFLLHTLYALGAGLMGVALAAIYLLPMLVEMRYIKIDQWTSGSYSYLQHFVYFSQFLSPQWGYGYAGPGLLDDFSFQLGIVAVALVSFALVFMLARPFAHRGTALFFLASAVAVIVLMSPLAASLWQVLPIAALVQFPWRLLGVTAFMLALVAGSLLADSKLQSVNSEAQITNYKLQMTNDKIQPAAPQPFILASRPSSLILCLVVVLASSAYTLPQYTDIPAWAETPLAVVNWDRASIVDRVGMVSFTQQQPQTSPLEPKYLNGEPLTAAELIAGTGTVDTLHRGGASSAVRVKADGPVTLQFYTYDYPGWQVTLNDQLIAHRHELPYGLVTVDLPAGDHTVGLRMGSTPVRTAGAVISGMAAVIIAALVGGAKFLQKRKNYVIFLTT